MINRDTWSPTAASNLDYDVNLEPSLRGIIVKAPGTLFLVDIDDNAISLEFAAPDAGGDQPYSTFPARLDLQIRKIVGNGSGSAGDGSTGTDIALANLIGLR